jgi:hypothetical protein
MYIQKVISRKTFIFKLVFCWRWKITDPHRNIMDPEHTTTARPPPTPTPPPPTAHSAQAQAVGRGVRIRIRSKRGKM